MSSDQPEIRRMSHFSYASMVSGTNRFTRFTRKMLDFICLCCIATNWNSQRWVQLGSWLENIRQCSLVWYCVVNSLGCHLICTVHVHLYSIWFKCPKQRPRMCAIKCLSIAFRASHRSTVNTSAPQLNDHRWRFEFLYLETVNRLYPQIQFSQSHEHKATQSNRSMKCVVRRVQCACVSASLHTMVHFIWCWAQLLSAVPYVHLFRGRPPPCAHTHNTQHFMAFHFAFYLFVFSVGAYRSLAHINLTVLYLDSESWSIQSHLNRCNVNTAHIKSEYARARIFCEFVSVVFAYVCCTFRHRFERHSTFKIIQFRMFLICTGPHYVTRKTRKHDI